MEEGYIMTLKDQRNKKGLSQSELAAVSGIPLRTIQQYECGQRNIDHAKLDSLCTLALSLHCSIYDILNDDQLKTKLKKSV